MRTCTSVWSLCVCADGTRIDCVDDVGVLSTMTLSDSGVASDISRIVPSSRVESGWHGVCRGTLDTDVVATVGMLSRTLTFYGADGRAIRSCFTQSTPTQV